MVVEMRYVLGQHALEMAAVEDQYSVQQLAADGADPAFGDRVRPGRSHGCAQNVDGFAGEHGSNTPVNLLSRSRIKNAN
jgi:hypothetical protein